MCITVIDLNSCVITKSVLIKEIICGKPGEISHGKIIGNNYFYGSTISYNCDANYNLTRGDNQQQCTSYGTWSGRKPVCACKIFN